MQILTIAYARNVLNLKKANSIELDPATPDPVISTMEDQVEKIKNKNYGATMRLGAYSCVLKPGTVAYQAYLSAKALASADNKKEIHERHRHRYEVNNKYVKALEDAGLVFSGIYKEKNLMEIAELPRKIHPFYLGVQFHPEFLSRPLRPHPLFTAFIRASVKKGKS